MHSTCLFPSSLQEIFVMHNTWTDAENYLLVEKLVSKTEEEAWKEVAEKCDGSGTYETESYKCKAIRKYAIYNGLAVEAVTLETVQSSPEGLVGWAEMNVVVPGIDSTPKPPATPQAAAAVPSENAATEPEKSKGKGKNKRGRGKEQESQEQSTRKTPRTKAKKELSGIQTAEASAKEILQFLQMSQQVMEKVAGSGDELPSEWKWARAFLEGFHQNMARFKEALKPADGDELTDFVDELKLNILGKGGFKSLKKSYGNRHEAMLTLFVDRCYSIGSTLLGFLPTNILS